MGTGDARRRRGPRCRYWWRGRLDASRLLIRARSLARSGRRTFAGVAAIAALSVAGAAQDLSVVGRWHREGGYLALQQAARDAATDHSALLVASHPDDRYLMLAAYLRFRLGWRVTAVLLTRGEGGQNSLGAETGVALGRLRTLETEAGAARLDTRVEYLDRYDAGFCRSAAETIELWGREATSRALAAAIRRNRPDVVLTTHDPDEAHGHDLALLELLPAALELAARTDLELGEGWAKQPWRPKRVWRGATKDEMPGVVLPVDAFDRVRGDTYRSLAYRALTEHKTQAPFAPMTELFAAKMKLVAIGSAPPEDSEDPLSDGLADWSTESSSPELRAEQLELDRRLARLEQRLGAPELVDEAIGLRLRLVGLRERWRAAAPEADLTRWNRRLEALDRVIRHAAAIRLRIDTGGATVAVPGQAVLLRLSLFQGGAAQLRNWTVEAEPKVDRFQPIGDAGSVGELAVGSTERIGSYRVGERGESREQLLDRIFSGSDFVSPMRLRVQVNVASHRAPAASFRLEWTLPVGLDLRPAVELQVLPQAVLLTKGQRSARFAVRVRRNTSEPLEARLIVRARPGFVITPMPVAVRMDRQRDQDYSFEVRVPPGLDPGVRNLHVQLGKRRAVLPLHIVDADVAPSLKVGLIRGADDTAAQVLRAMCGESLRLLDSEDLGVRPLDDLDTIVVDIRALRERAEDGVWRAARANFLRLLEFAERGGRLVVLYHKDSEFNVEQTGFVGGPYPLRIGKSRVTREDADVVVLRPKHELLTWPNRIRSSDWDGWVVERGLYFPEQFAPEYVALLAMGDPNYARSNGSLLHARYGQGDYVYCALSLYRQLKTFHAGACRLFANLVSPARAQRGK